MVDRSPYRGRAEASVSRRGFIKRAALLGAAGLMAIGPAGWAARAAASGGSRRRLVVIFLRGAVDGLNVVVPYGEGAYYENRPTIALARAGSDGAVLDLDGCFGLNPALAPILPMWNEGTLAFVHACGSPDPTRSHFDAQDYMESGTPGVKRTADGWMSRVLAAMPGLRQPTTALSLGPTVPRILSGKMPVANLPLGRAAVRPRPLDRPLIEAAFDRLYTGDDALSRAYREGRAARAPLMAELEQDMTAADGGAPAPAGFSNDAIRLARLIRRDSGIRLAFLALGGWDTHVNQGAATGQLANHLRPLAQGLADFRDALGTAWTETVVLIISEFGRAVRQNGNGGTDHGHANVMWAMGGPIRGRKVYGRWPGLAPGQLYQGRDLAVTTDFREPIAQLLESHLGLGAAQRESVFPGRPASSGNTSGLVRV
jgi:uncharacterized protein (DUF1501 family)